MTCALSSVRSSFSLKITGSLYHLSLSSCHLPQGPSDYPIQIKPTHPPSQHSHHVPVLFSFWHILLFEAILLVYLFTCLLLLSSPLQGEALSLLLGADPKTQKSTVINGWDGTLTLDPRDTAPLARAGFHNVHVLLVSQPNIFLICSNQKNLKPWKMLPNTYFSRNV